MATVFTSKSIDDKIEKFCRDNRIKKDFQWHYKYIIDVIYIRPYIDRSFSENSFVPVNYNTLRKIISFRDCTFILENLISMGILECDNHYIVGEKSKGYRIVEKKNLKWKESVVKDVALALKIDKREESMSGKGYEIAAAWFRAIVLDYNKAKKYIDNHYDRDSHKYESALMNIQMLKYKNHYWKTDDSGHRLHTNLTVLPTPLRKFLTIGGLYLYQSDVANSQPVFLYTILKGNDSINQDELIKYRDIVGSGQFYEFMAEKSNFNDLDLTKYEDRSKFKRTIFGGVLFDRNRKKLSRWEKLFQEEFPTIFNYIREKKKKDYTSMAIMLQKAESKFIFSLVEQISKELNNPILTTIHDCIVSDESHINKVAEIMRREFNLRFGIIPTIKVEKF